MVVEVFGGECFAIVFYLERIVSGFVGFWRFNRREDGEVDVVGGSCESKIVSGGVRSKVRRNICFILL